MTSSTRDEFDHERDASRVLQVLGAGKWNLVFYAALITVCCVAITSLMSVPVGNLSSPGPALWPMTVSVVTITMTLAAAVLVRSAPEAISRNGLARVVASIALLILFALLFDHFNFLTAGVATLFLLTFGVCRQGLLSSCAVAVFASAGSYLLFNSILNVPL